MTKYLQATRSVIDAISRDSWIDDDPQRTARALVMLYHLDRQHLLAAIDDLLRDETWSEDRTPYEWLAAVREFVA